MECWIACGEALEFQHANLEHEDVPPPSDFLVHERGLCHGFATGLGVVVLTVCLRCDGKI
jgi:hypothetical protein